MQIEHLREFLMLACTANISETAKELYLTQSTLSRHITALEEEIGAKLFSRSAHSVQLTPIGRQFASDAKTIIDLFNQAMGNIETMKHYNETTLRLGYLYDVGRIYMPTFQKPLEIEASKDGIRIKYAALEHGELMNRLSNDTIDVALTIDTDPRVRDFTERVVLGTDHYCAVIAKTHELAEKPSVTLADLASLPFIAPDPFAMSGMHDFQMSQFDKAGVEPSIASYYEDIPTFLAEIARGNHVGMALSHHRDRYKDQVAFLPISDCDATCNICCIWKKKTESRIAGQWPQALRAGADDCRGLSVLLQENESAQD